MRRQSSPNEARQPPIDGSIRCARARWRQPAPRGATLHRTPGVSPKYRERAGCACRDLGASPQLVADAGRCPCMANCDSIRWTSNGVSTSSDRWAPHLQYSASASAGSIRRRCLPSDLPTVRLPTNLSGEPSHYLSRNSAARSIMERDLCVGVLCRAGRHIADRAPYST